MPLKITDPNLTLLMDTYGMTLKYYAGRLCSCIADNNGQPRVGCGCNLGYYYDSPPDTVHAVRSNYSYKFTNSPNGRVFDGGAKFTIPPAFEGVPQRVHSRIARGDVLVVSNKVRRETEFLTKGTRDTLYAFDVQEIMVVSQEGLIYTPTVDYTVSDRTINWVIGGTAPADGTSYGVEYTCQQQFKVWDNGANSRGTDEDNLAIMIPCVLRRFVPSEQPNALDTFSTNDNIFS